MVTTNCGPAKTASFRVSCCTVSADEVRGIHRAQDHEVWSSKTSNFGRCSGQAVIHRHGVKPVIAPTQLRELLPRRIHHVEPGEARLGLPPTTVRIVIGRRSGGRRRGPEAVVDVDHGDAGRAGVEHPQERREAAERGAVAHAGGTAMTGTETSPPTTLGSAPSIPATTMITSAWRNRSLDASRR